MVLIVMVLVLVMVLLVVLGAGQNDAGAEHDVAKDGMGFLHLARPLQERRAL